MLPLHTTHPSSPQNDHGVNNAEGALAWPAMDARLFGDAAKPHETMALALHMLETYQAQPNALFCADEVFCGRAPHRGTETCAIVEAMASLEQGFAVLGEPALADRVEALAFNALPASLTADMWAHVYVQQANSVFAGNTGPKLSVADDPSLRHHGLHYRHFELDRTHPHDHGEGADGGRGDGHGNDRHDAHHHATSLFSADAAEQPVAASAGASGDGCPSSLFGADGEGGHASGHARGGGCGGGRRLQSDTPSGEDQGSNFFGVSHFPCCITNFPQGWPKFVASALMMNASANAFVVAFLLPLNATLPTAIGGGASVTIDTLYPFGDEATIRVSVPDGHATTMHVRVPRWAVGATVDGKRAANGTLHAVALAAGEHSVSVQLPARVQVERGWGVSGLLAGSPVVFDDAHAGAGAPLVDVPATSQDDWMLEGGAGFVPSRLSGDTDVRTGNPGDTAWLYNTHPIYGLSHAVGEVHAALSYAAGYTPAAGEHKNASSASLHLVDALTREDVSGPLLTWPALGEYSFDDYHGYSSPMANAAANFSVGNAKPLLLALRISNNERNLQLPTSLLALSVRWGTAVSPEPPAPVEKYLSPPANAAVVRRGSLLFALHPEENHKVVKTYTDALPFRPSAVDYEISTGQPWAFALELPAEVPLPNATRDHSGLAATALEFDPTPSAGWSIAKPFATDEYAFSISASARALDEATWGYWKGSKITAQPPASPLNLTGRAKQLPREPVRLVPFGGTNIRISVFPWLVGN